MMAARYAHAKQFKRHQRQLRILRSICRIIRDIRRRIEGQPALEEAFALRLAGPCKSARSSSASAAGSFIPSMLPEVECIGKGKAAAPYEFGVKESIVTKPPGARWPVRAARQVAAR
jgi:IS5 family transposase